MVDNVLVNKAESIERCLRRVAEEYRGHEDELQTNFTRQDAIVLNLLRACETAIAMAMHVVRAQRLGVPQSSRDAFDRLQEAGLLTAELAGRMKAMVGFRNVAVHSYRALDLAVVRAIIDKRLNDFDAYTAALLCLEGRST